MPLKGMIIKDGATALTPTGGTDMIFTSGPQQTLGMLALQNAAQADFRVRENMQVRQIQPKLLANGEYTRDSKSIVYCEPKILASGKTVINFIRVERCVHPESTSVEAKSLNMSMGQLLTDTDTDGFWTGGSMD